MLGQRALAMLRHMKPANHPARNGIGRRTAAGAALGAAVALLCRPSLAQTPTPAAIRLGYIRSTLRTPTISLVEAPAANDGLAGAQLAMADDNTTGRFMGQSFELVDVKVGPNGDPLASLAGLVAQGVTLAMTDLPAEAVLRLADAGRSHGVTLFNIAAPDDRLRNQDCRANLIHVAPSRAMLADALAQYLVWKKWTRWVLATGSHPGDVLLGDAYRRAAKRFGARIVKSLTYVDTGESRQTDSGVVQTQQQMPVFTQGLPEYDVLVTADENQVFAGYLPFRTWDARPVAGSAGLEPVTWDPSSESWGGAQLQDRFVRLFHRRMTPLDMQAWTAARMVGEAASRSRSADPRGIAAFIQGPQFEVAAYKGQKLTLRDWDWQLRQPILLSDGRTVVSISPQPGFLHQFTELDTLGYDRPETTCRLH